MFNLLNQLANKTRVKTLLHIKKIESYILLYILDISTMDFFLYRMIVGEQHCTYIIINPFFLVTCVLIFKSTDYQAHPRY